MSAVFARTSWCSPGTWQASREQWRTIVWVLLLLMEPLLCPRPALTSYTIPGNPVTALQGRAASYICKGAEAHMVKLRARVTELVGGISGTRAQIHLSDPSPQPFQNPPCIPSIQGSEALLRSSSRSRSLQPKETQCCTVERKQEPAWIPTSLALKALSLALASVGGAWRDVSKCLSPFLAEPLESRSRNEPFSPATSELCSRTSDMV